MILAAIDIGSNAARLLITDVQVRKLQEPEFRKLNLFRVPLRLGFDVFETGLISTEKQHQLVQTLKAFRHLMNVYEVQAMMVCATSAMRDATNTAKVLEHLKKETGLDVQVISGEMEANLVYENHIAEHLDTEHRYMYIDVGGGSTEISVFGSGELLFKKSYNIGTIRLFKGKVRQDEWDRMKQDIRQATKGQKNVMAIGSGGNINKIFTMSKKKEGKPLPLDLLKDYHKELASLDTEERMSRFGLRPDRADVIVPALQIYIQAMRWADAGEIYVPKIGLADGLIHHLWDEIRNTVVTP